MSPAAIKQCMLSLETAIERVETDITRGELLDMRFPRLGGDPAGVEAAPRQAALPAPSPEPIEDDAADLDVAGSIVDPDSNDGPTGTAVAVPLKPRDRLVLRTEPDEPLRTTPVPARADRPQVEIVYPERETSHAASMRRRAWLWFIAWPLALLTVAGVAILVFYLALAGRLDVQSAQTRQLVEQQLANEVKSSGLPLPQAYGVFAVSNGRLEELMPLPIKAPDSRVALSAEIKTPSATLLPDGKLVFVVFRRDLVNNAPQKASIRVVARLAHATTVNAGKSARSDVDGSWRIRNNSYDFKVAPLNENHEMIAIRPETDDFAFPAGRYALVLSGLAFDFTVDGPITASAQCLESFETVSGPIYTECPTK